MQIPEAREVIAFLVVVGSFGLLAGYVFTGGHLDSGTGVAIVGFCAAPLGLVLGFYFGKANGTNAALGQLAVQLSTQATQTLTAAAQRRAGDSVTAPSPLPPRGGDAG